MASEAERIEHPTLEKKIPPEKEEKLREKVKIEFDGYRIVKPRDYSKEEELTEELKKSGEFKDIVEEIKKMMENIQSRLMMIMVISST